MIKFRMKGEGPHIDDEKLIDEVIKYSFLYDTKSPDYRNLPKRHDTWIQIADVLGIDNVSVNRRWKVLREKYCVSYKKELHEGIPNSHWSLYNKLKFLQPFVNTKISEQKLPKSSNESTCEINQFKKSPFDELMLIKLIRERPELYDKKHDDFRSSSLRKKSWDEISNATNWNVDTLQKRWRTMRDRFVRELRRTQNLDSDSQMSCTPFFREMLFLVRHVRSNKYEVEANIEDLTDTKTISDSGDDIAKEEWIVQEEKFYQDTNSETETYQYVEESIEMDEEVSKEEMPTFQCEYIEEEEEEQVSYQIVNVTPQEIIEDVNESLEQEQHDEPSSRKKRTAIDEIQEHHIKNKQPRTDLISPARTSNDDVNDKDEDIAFGNTIGCMLKKIPLHLKTAVKLKLLSSLAEFEAHHNLM